MGIVNLTHDSFYNKSRAQTQTTLLKMVEQQLVEGADIIDLGGYSSRPGAEHINIDEEVNRVLPAVSSIKKEFGDLFISIDTFRSEVVKAVFPLGIDFINDISAGELDKDMIELVGTLGVPYIAMHMPGNPQNMQEHTQYTQVTQEVFSYLQAKLYQCNQAGIKDVILDPGFGFGKTIEQNFQMVKEFELFNQLRTPLLAGVSRKSMFYKLLDTTAQEVLPATTAIHWELLQKGARILRVHDVKEAKQLCELYTALNPNKHNR